MARYRNSDYLFSEGDLWSALQSHFAKVQQLIASIPTDRFRAMSDEEILEQTRTELAVTPLELDESSIEMVQEETKVDVSGDHRRVIFSREEPFYIDGVRVTVSIPFTGDPLLWKLKPSHWSSIFPRGNVSDAENPERGILEITIEQPADEEPARIKEVLDKELECIRFYINNQRSQIMEENSKLHELIRSEISKGVATERA